MGAILPANPWVPPPALPPRTKASRELSNYSVFFGCVAAVASVSTVFLFFQTGYGTPAPTCTTTSEGKEQCTATPPRYANGQMALLDGVLMLLSAFFHGGWGLYYNGNWVLAGPYGAGSTMVAFWINLVTGALFAYVVKEESRSFLWFMLSLSCWFFALSRILKPRYDLGLQEALLGFTLGKVVTLPGYEVSRAMVFVICLIIGTVRPWLDKFRGAGEN